MTPAEFVTQVYNVQEGVIIDDLWPIDDKYREVIMQANHVLDDFIQQADWSFLRESIILGDTNPLHPNDITIPKYVLPEHVDKVSTLFEDAIKLHAHTNDGQIIEDMYIPVPTVSRGVRLNRKFRHYKADLRAQVYGRVITFNRRPCGEERNRVVVVDVQKKIPHLHICNEKCTTEDGILAYVDESGVPRDTPLVCKDIEKEVVPAFYGIDNYLVWKTAYNTSKYSPPAGGIRAELNDQANKTLSKLRQIDASKTAPDVVKRSYNFRVDQVW